MPATISRMSASSSTIRMSAAICRSLACWHSCSAVGGHGGRLVARDLPARRLAQRQRNSDEGPMRSAGTRRRVLQRQRAAMLLHAFHDDGKTEAGALVALGGDVGLEQSVAVVLGQ